MKQVLILGSTGSIGRNTLKVIEGLNHQFKVFGLVAHSNWQLLSKQIQRWSPRVVGLIEPNAIAQLRRCFSGKDLKIYEGMEGIKKLINLSEVDIVVIAIGGAAGLIPTLCAVEAGKTIALANKESIVMAGEIIMKKAKVQQVEIRPIDSEHSAIFQALQGRNSNEVRNVILTASGGPFYLKEKQALSKVTVKDALNHPTWRMGKKITIDSATLMNKAYEVIEAKWLFALKPEQIKIVIHPQSIIHSMVEFQDGSIIAQLSKPDMKIPIQFALTYPHRLPSRLFVTGNYLKFNDKLKLTFIQPDFQKFPALRLGYEVLKKGGTTGAVLVGANEEAVKLFMNNNLSFTEITPLVEKVLRRHKVINQPELDDILQAEQWARKEVYKCLNR